MQPGEVEREDRAGLDLAALLDGGLRELIGLVGASGVTELAIERGDVKIRIACAPAASAAPPPPAVAAAEPLPEASEEGLPLAGFAQIVSPVVGTFFSSPTPGDDPFVRVGDPVEPGQTVGIVEAMKVMNSIESEVRGRVAEMLAQNGQAVEYGQPLILVDTSGSRE